MGPIASLPASQNGLPNTGAQNPENRPGRYGTWLPKSLHIANPVCWGSEPDRKSSIPLFRFAWQEPPYRWPCSQCSFPRHRRQFDQRRSGLSRYGADRVLHWEHDYWSAHRRNCRAGRRASESHDALRASRRPRSDRHRTCLRGSGYPADREHPSGEAHRGWTDYADKGRPIPILPSRVAEGRPDARRHHGRCSGTPPAIPALVAPSRGASRRTGLLRSPCRSPQRRSGGLFSRHTNISCSTTKLPRSPALAPDFSQRLESIYLRREGVATPAVPASIGPNAGRTSAAR